MSKFRCLNHKMPIVSGRYKNIPRQERICNICEKDQIGDEFHYLFQCNALEVQRKKYLKRYYRNNPNTYKMNQLFNSEKKTVLSSLAKFCVCIISYLNQ